MAEQYRTGSGMWNMAFLYKRLSYLLIIESRAALKTDGWMFKV